jgi:hypothetical protein
MYVFIKGEKGEAVPLTGREGPWGCEMSRLTDDGEFVSLTRRHAFTPRKISATHFCQEAELTPGP